jgi:two-component system, OmpR family, sensor histidine kinase BaeS
MSEFHFSLITSHFSLFTSHFSMRSLTFKLTLAFLAVSLTSILLVALLAGRTTADEFGSYNVRQADRLLAIRLATYYELNGSWEGIGQAWPFVIAQGQGGMHGRPVRLLADDSGRVIIPGLNYQRGDRLPAAVLAQALPIEVNSQTAGYLLVSTAQMGMMAPTAAETDFLQRINRTLILASLGATALSLLLAVVLARIFTQPLRELTQATRAVARGHLSQTVPVRSQDELGELALAFNQMSQDLARSQNQRRQMTADIAHELRTPLSLILGYAEALRDGALPATPEGYTVIHDEAVRLNRLVEDLRTLSLAEAGELPLTRRATAVAPLLEQVVAAHQPRAQQQEIELQTRLAPDLPPLMADPDRLKQVIVNLLDNALRHTPAGGRVTVGAQLQNGRLSISVQDSGPGIPPEDLPYIFDRFYRADKSRARGGSGLGLAIARSIVLAHGGRLAAASQPGQGTTFTITFDSDVVTGQS